MPIIFSIVAAIVIINVADLSETADLYVTTNNMRNLLMRIETYKNQNKG